MLSTLSHTSPTMTDDRPVSAAEVHKLDASEVLLTDWQHIGPDHFGICARWPALHRFYAEAAHDRRDALMLIECVRQSIPMLCHGAYDTPFGFRQAWEDLQFAVEPSILGRTGTDLEIRLDVRCSDVIRRGTRVGGMTMDVRASWQGLPAATVRTRFNNQSPAVYQRLRGANGDMATAHAAALAPGRPVSPELVGRSSAADVVLAPAPDHPPYTWFMRNDLDHPILFDHPVDHSPGMLLLEAARQAALARCSQAATVVGMTTRFIRYAEFDVPCLVSTAPLPVTDGRDGAQTVRVALSQNDRVVFTADVTTARV
ncbi:MULTISPECIES: ScbA/BarX family gamma-butyrolactone biosynthesis protein [unclassified Streptomyces]|uniref:ScbA/BarX family gamma-butyrolactone biosynthesis protein n=1 Tax=unclassified Streptomyces TaxID=2593676 RepID=UPI000DB9C732|nr:MULTISPECIES: ScbA/BarX family gamma-butyrolactone biosynthesis protein [unclassified Streptomyces]MYT75253.1 AfsA/ScbA [Streptomyces sp. SID8367]RAJ77209.1 A-factor biosynthesis hotdog protein [Streptomyces sp. PsTaAH-137]